ncbi:uncharacterized protein LOC124125439 [Haliotis rufescens]|uniref:uncharacterized protein LOC124125439 n=1 Tax=Haliotis rufescens TaxID=6454 RepID=UPI00201F21DB|nr:uncharacterized protein LOC124125439 [Haliotis rufescens]
MAASVLQALAVNESPINAALTLRSLVSRDDNSVNTDDSTTKMSDARVHIVTCLNVDCEIQYARMCEDLETRGVVCVMEGRGDYGIGSTFVKRFKEIVESTLVTIIHLCPDMINRLSSLTDVLRDHQTQKYLFIHVKSTPKEVPEVYKKVTKMLLVNDSYYNKIIDKVVEIAQQRPSCVSFATELAHTSASDLSSATREEDGYDSDSGTCSDVFVSHVENQQCRDTGVYFLSSKIQYKPHHLLKWSSKGELREMCRQSRLYDSSNRSNTVRCLLTKVLPEIFAKKDISAIVELLAVPVPVIQNKVLTKLGDILLSTKHDTIDRDDLKSAEKALFERCLTETDVIDPVFLHNLICTYLLTLTYLAVSQESRHSSLDYTITRVKQYISQPSSGNEVPLSDISVFVDDIQKRIDDVTKAVTACGTNWKQLWSVKKKSWPVHFSMILGTLMEVFHGDPQTALVALDTLPALLKLGKLRVRNVLKKPKPQKRVVQLVTTGMVAYLNVLGDAVGEDIEDRAKAAFTALGLSLKDLDRSIYVMTRCLLFSQSPVIRQGAVSLWKDANAESTHSLMVTEVLTHLHPISINRLHKQPTNHSTSSTSWKVASTQIGSEIIMIHVNLPTEDVLVEHSRSPPKSSDCGHLTTVEILRALSTHKGILSMWAYRIDQFPVFYITEDYSQQNFQKVLYYSAKNKDWFNPLELVQFLIQALEAVIALHEHGTILRDLTAASFAYNKQSKSVKLCRFILTRTCGRDETLVDRECSTIPTRWSSPESLKKRHFSMRSDYWMVGHLIYEVITHGCLPYSDLKGQNETSIGNLIKEDRKKLCQERCIPTSVFDAIQCCTRYDDTHRLSVCEAKSRLEETFERYNGRRELPEKITSVTPDILFPGLDRSSYQALPKEDSEGDNPYDEYAYQNFEKSQTTSTKDEPLYEDFGPSYDVDFLLKPNQRMDILYRRLTQTEESQLNTESIPGIYGHVAVEKRNETEYMVYDFPTEDCVSLSNVMDVRSLGLWSVEYIRCLSAVAKTLSLLHQQNWVHGCLCADNIWIAYTEDEGNYTVYFTDLGYIRMSSDTEDGMIADDSFVVPQDDHVYRRSPPEAIRDGTYSWASDVFSFGLILWNGFSNYSTYHNQSHQNILESIPKDKLYEYLTTTSGQQILPKPEKCPDTIYSLMLLCWSPERHERPRMTVVQQKLLEHISNEVRPYRNPDMYYTVDTEGQSSEYDSYAYPDNADIILPDDYDSVEGSSLQCDGPRSSCTLSTLVGGGTGFSVDKETFKVHPSPSKPSLKPKPLPRNETNGKVLQLQKYFAESGSSSESSGSRKNIYCRDQNTVCGQLPHIGKPAHFFKSNLESFHEDLKSVSSENYQYDMFNVNNVQKTKTNEKPRPPPKPKHLSRHTPDVPTSDQPCGYASSSDDHIYDNCRHPVDTSLELPPRNRPESQQPTNQTGLKPSTVPQRVNGPPSLDSPPPLPPRPPPRRKSEN